MDKSTLTVFEPLSYTSRLTFDGRAGIMQPYFAKVELKILTKDRNIPVKPLLSPFLNLISSINNRHIVWVEDPSLYSGLLEPKNGQSVQEFYSSVKKLVEKDGFWFSLNSQSVQNTLGGISLAVIKEQPTVENICYYMVNFIKNAFPEKVSDYHSITVISNNSPLSGKASTTYF